jgi:hypothetical protein
MTELVIFSHSGRVPASLRTHLDPRWKVQVVQGPIGDWPAHYYLTTTRLSVAVERAAQKCGAMPVVLPEGIDWLLGQLSRHQGPVRLFSARRVGDGPWQPVR